MRIVEWPADALSWPHLASLTFAVALFGLQYYTSTSTWRALGPLGFYYADFFVEGLPLQLTYGGIYRYTNNPDCISGFASLYGAALVARSGPLALLALALQLGHFAFLHYVEGPHMEQVYGARREDAALWATVKGNVERAAALRKDPGERRVLFQRLRASFASVTQRARQSLVEELGLRTADSLRLITRLTRSVRRMRDAEPDGGQSPPRPRPDSGDEDESGTDVQALVRQMAVLRSAVSSLDEQLTELTSTGPAPAGDVVLPTPQRPVALRARRSSAGRRTQPS